MVDRNIKKDKYKKIKESFKHYNTFKVRPSSLFADYHLCEILKTTDKELEPFIGKCLAQKLEKIHQTITIPDYVFKFMLGNF